VRGIEFHNRYKETKEIRAILDRRPTQITFVYGPINSGKTELITHTIEELPDEHVVFYINLRTKLLSSYDDFIESSFEMEIATDGALKGGVGKKTLAELVSSVTNAAGMPINKEFLDCVFKDNKPKNAFSYMIKLFLEVKASGKQTVLILDELQKIGDVKMNGSLIYELFNFFIDLAKELHLAHVFVVSSDSLAIEEVYSEAMLEDRCRYLLVDDFDEETTMAFLEANGLSEGEKELVWHHCGGKPICLVELANAEERGQKVKGMLTLRTGEIRQRIKVLKIVNKKILFEGEEVELKYKHIIKILDGFLDGGSYAYEMITPEIVYPVKENILFVDSVRGIIKPQSRLNLLAIREVVKDV